MKKTGPFLKSESAREKSRREKREERSFATATRRKQIVEGALVGESLGPHPGRVLVRIEARVYDAIEGRYRVVPGWKIEMGVETEEALMQAKGACEEGLREWIYGTKEGG